MKKALWVTAAVVALICVLLLPSFAYGADKCGSFDRIMIAMRLTKTLYPELSGRELSVAFSVGYPSAGPRSFPTDASSLKITFDKIDWRLPGKEDEKPNAIPPQRPNLELPIYLNFNFIDENSAGYDVVCRPVIFMKSTESSQMREAENVINAHPEWSDAQMLKTARQYGLRYGPEKKAAILQLVLSKRLDRFYGPLRIKNVRFEIYGNAQKCKGCTFADLRWYVDAEEVGTHRMLLIIVEGFGGKITDLREYRSAR